MGVQIAYNSLRPIVTLLKWRSPLRPLCVRRVSAVNALDDLSSRRRRGRRSIEVSTGAVATGLTDQEET